MYWFNYKEVVGANEYALGTHRLVSQLLDAAMQESSLSHCCGDIPRYVEFEVRVRTDVPI